MAFRDIRRSRKFLSAEEIRLLLLALVLFSGLLALNIYIARILPGGEQLYLRWSGARAFLLEQTEPYSATIAERTQVIAYGREASAGEYPFVLHDPFHIVLLYTPLAIFSDFAIARGLWMLLSEIALILMIQSLLRSLEWLPPNWLYFLLVFASIFGYYSLIAFGAGTPSVAIVVMVFFLVQALRSFADELAGALLFLLAYQWEVTALFFLFIIVFVLGNKRWRVLSGFFMALAVLLVISFLAYPGWGLPYVKGILSNWYRSDPLRFGYVMAEWFPSVRFSIGLWTSLLLGVIVFIEWLGAVDAHYRHIVWVVCLSLAVTPLMGFAIFPSNHIALLPSLILLILLIWERWTRQRTLYVLLILLAVFLFPFWLYYRILTGAPAIYTEALTVLPPVATVIGLYWMRWWAFRTPRTWFDQIGARK